MDAAAGAPLADAVGAFPTDVNDSGVIVAPSYNTQWVPSAVRWRNSGSGYVVEILPRLPGDTSSYATAIDDPPPPPPSFALGYVPTGTGWPCSDAGGVVDIYGRYNWSWRRARSTMPVS